MIHTSHLLLILAFTFLIHPQNLSILLQLYTKRSATKYHLKYNAFLNRFLLLQCVIKLLYIFELNDLVSNTTSPINHSELVRFL